MSIHFANLLRSSHPNRVGSGLRFKPKKRFEGLNIIVRNIYGTANMGSVMKNMRRAVKNMRN